MVYKNIISIIFCAVLFSGCVVSTKNVKLEKTVQPKQDSRLSYISRVSPFSVLTPFKAIVSGLLGEGSLAKTAVDKLYNDKNGSFSIANYLNVKLTEEVSKKYNLAYDKNPENKVFSRDYEIEDFIDKVKNIDYVVDNYVTDWRVMYYKLLPGYYITLTTKMRIIDVKTKKVISEGFCQKETEYDKNNTLSYEKLFDNNSEGLIRESKKLADECLAQYRELI